jgi:hypothetical protein
LGTAVLLYSVSAPAKTYDQSLPVAGSILASFRPSDRAPAAQASTTAPAGPVQFVPWSDPTEHAFTLSVPREWKTVGGVHVVSGLDARAAVNLFAPGSGMFVRYGQADFGAFIEPFRSPYGNMQSGLYPLGDGTQLQVAPYQTGQQFARFYLENTRPLCTGIRVTGSINRPELIAKFAKQIQDQDVAPDAATIGEVTYTCSQSGTQLQGSYVAITARSATALSRAGMGGAMWSVLGFGGYLALPHLAPAAASIADHVQRSMQINPQWKAQRAVQAEQIVAQDNLRARQTRTRALAAIADNLRQTSETVTSSYWARQKTYDEISRKRENAILGTVDVVDPTTREQYKVSYDSNFYWMNDQGYQAGTLTADAPGAGWTELLKLP